MALPNDSFAVTASGSGTNIATNLISGKEYEVVHLADEDGHLQGSLPAYVLYQTPAVTTASARDYLDLFNATGSGRVIRIRGIFPVQQVSAANALVPAYEFQVFRTSAVGTGGTTTTYNSATVPAAGAANITALDTNGLVLSGVTQITSRGLPTGGATADDYLFSMYLLTEETNPATTLSQGINYLPTFPYEQPLEIRENQGLKIRHNTPLVASTGMNFGFLVSFTVV